MSEYTPETNAVRDFYADHRAPTYPWTRIGADEIAAVEQAQAEWDRWYARERARWQAAAWEKGWDAAVDAGERCDVAGGDYPCGQCAICNPPNPYESEA